MNQFRTLEKKIYEMLNTPEEDRFWNASIDDLKKNINKIENNEEKQFIKVYLDVLIDKSQKKNKENSYIGQTIINILGDCGIDTQETSNKLREEMVIPPFTFDFLTRQTLSEQVNLFKLGSNQIQC